MIKVIERDIQIPSKHPVYKRMPDDYMDHIGDIRINKLGNTVRATYACKGYELTLSEIVDLKDCMFKLKHMVEKELNKGG